MKKKLIVLSGFVFSLTPVVALAAVIGGDVACIPGVSVNTDLTSVLCKIGELLSAVVPVLVALGVVYFIWGVISYILGSDEETKKSGKMKMIYGIIGFAVIVSLWGLVGILTRTFDVNNSGSITLPTVKFGTPPTPGDKILTVTSPTNGKITTSDLSINCGSEATGTIYCTKTVAHGTVITLTETPKATYTFSGWGGNVPATCTTGATCNVTLDANKTVSATFIAP